MVDGQLIEKEFEGYIKRSYGSPEYPRVYRWAVPVEKAFREQLKEWGEIGMVEIALLTFVRFSDIKSIDLMDIEDKIV